MRASSACQYELLPTAKHQYLTVFMVFCVITSGVDSVEDLKLQFLRGVPRFSNNTGYTDFYVCCNARGSFLGWQVGTDRLSGFRANDAGRVIVDTRSAYEYSATLLSSQPLPARNQHQMDSVIMVTFIGVIPSSFEVTCTSETNTSTIQVVGSTSAVERTNSSDHNEVVLDYILSSRIVQNKEFTHIFICGTRDVRQLYELETSRIGFSDRDGIGQVRPVLSEDGYTVTILGVLVSQHPFTLTSILFVSEDFIVNVTCFDGHHRVELPSNPATTPMPRASTSDASTLYVNPMSTPPPEPPVLSSSSLQTTPPMLESAMNITSSRPSHTLSTDVILNNANVNVIVFPVVLSILSLLVITSGIAAYIWWYRCCSRSPRLCPCSPEEHQKAVIAQDNGFNGTCKGEIVTVSRTRRDICCSILRKVESTPNDKGDGDIDCGMETQLLNPFSFIANMENSIGALRIKPTDFVQMKEEYSMCEKCLEVQDNEELDESFSTVAETRSVEKKSSDCKVSGQDKMDTDMEKEQIELNEANDHSPGVEETPAEEHCGNAEQPNEQIDADKNELMAPLPTDIPYPAYQDFSCEQRPSKEDESTNTVNQHVLSNIAEDDDAAQPCHSHDTEVSSYEAAMSLPYSGPKSDDTVLPEEKRHVLSLCDSNLNKEHSRRSRKVCFIKGVKDLLRSFTKRHSEQSREKQSRQDGKTHTYHFKGDAYMWVTCAAEQVKRRRRHFNATKLVTNMTVAKKTREITCLIQQRGRNNITGLMIPCLHMKCYRNCWDKLQNGPQRFLNLENIMHRLCEAYWTLLDHV